MSLTQGFPSTFSTTQTTIDVLHNLDNETKKIYNDVNAIMAADGHTHTGNGSDGAQIDYSNILNPPAILLLTGGTLTGVLNEFKGANIASASTVNLTTATGNLVHITGTTAITAITLGSGMRREVIFDGILTLTHHATNNNLPGATNITTAVGDRATYWSDGATIYCTNYQKASGMPIVGGGGKGYYRNLEIIVTSNTLTTVTLDYACLWGGAEISALSATLNKATIGAVNGLDTGTIANSTWYYVYAIAKADGTKGVLMSLSDTAPTMPSGYIDKIRLGAIRTHSDGTLLKTIQSDRKVQYVTQSSGNTLVYPVMASGVSGTITTTVYTPIAVAVANFIPPTAGKIQTIIGNTLATGGNFIACSPNANFPNGIFATGTTAAPISAVGTAGTTANGTMVLETTNIYWACSFASGQLACIGWEDNL